MDREITFTAHIYWQYSEEPVYLMEPCDQYGSLEDFD